VSATGTVLLSAGGNIFAGGGFTGLTAQQAELRAGTADSNAGQIGTLSAPLRLSLAPGNTLHLFVPATVNPGDPNRAPATLPSNGVSTTLSLFTSPSLVASEDGFGQFNGFGDTRFTSQPENLLKTIQSQTGTVQRIQDVDWKSFDRNVSLFGTQDPAVCLPGDQRDEEGGKGGC
jgi:hypothetical protein